MKTVALPISPASRRGFSLFEMVMSISLIGVLVSLCVPMLIQTDSVYWARNQRNAQELCATCAMAQAAGLNFVQGNDVQETVRGLTRGGMLNRGAMKGRLFIVPGLSEEDIKGASRHLMIQNGELLYSKNELTPKPGDQKL